MRLPALRFSFLAALMALCLTPADAGGGRLSLVTVHNASRMGVRGITITGHDAAGNVAASFPIGDVPACGTVQVTRCPGVAVSGVYVYACPVIAFGSNKFALQGDSDPAYAARCGRTVRCVRITLVDGDQYWPMSGRVELHFGGGAWERFDLFPADPEGCKGGISVAERAQEAVFTNGLLKPDLKAVLRPDDHPFRHIKLKNRNARPVTGASVTNMSANYKHEITHPVPPPAYNNTTPMTGYPHANTGFASSKDLGGFESNKEGSHVSAVICFAADANGMFLRLASGSNITDNKLIRWIDFNVPDVIADTSATVYFFDGTNATWNSAKWGWVATDVNACSP